MSELARGVVCMSKLAREGRVCVCVSKLKSSGVCVSKQAREWVGCL